jgi:hypothetical protein
MASASHRHGLWRPLIRGRAGSDFVTISTKALRDLDVKAERNGLRGGLVNEVQICVDLQPQLR